MTTGIERVPVRISQIDNEVDRRIIDIVGDTFTFIYEAFSVKNAFTLEDVESPFTRQNIIFIDDGIAIQLVGGFEHLGHIVWTFMSIEEGTSEYYSSTFSGECLDPIGQAVEVGHLCSDWLIVCKPFIEQIKKEEANDDDKQ